MAIRALQPKGFGRPLGMYSHGMEANGLVVVAGQVGTTPDGGLAGPDVEAQTRQVFENVATVVGAAGCTMRDVIRLQTFLVSADDIAGYMAARQEVFPRYFPSGVYPPNTLLVLGVEREQRVLMVCLDQPEFVGTFWGAIKIGAVPVPVNTLLRAADYLYVLEDSRAPVAVVSAPLLAEVGPALPRATHLRHVLVAGGPPGPYLGWEDRAARAAASLEAAPTSPDDVAFWLYSSGSTGFPKAAVHLHHDMVVSTETY